MNFDKWRAKNLHLPEFMRDFHDQKDLFKTIHDIYQSDDPESSINVANFRDGMIYTLDVFLWFMASRGYTLQKCRAKFDDYKFNDLQKDIEQSRDRRTEMLAKAMGLTSVKK